MTSAGEPSHALRRASPEPIESLARPIAHYGNKPVAIREPRSRFVRPLVLDWTEDAENSAPRSPKRRHLMPSSMRAAAGLWGFLTLIQVLGSATVCRWF